MPIIDEPVVPYSGHPGLFCQYMAIAIGTVATDELVLVVDHVVVSHPSSLPH